MQNPNNFFYKKNRLQQIKGFYYTVRLGGISNAAHSMNLTQSTVSQQIQSLERDLKMQLLKRGVRNLSLTKDGKDFYALACPLMQEFESIFENFLNQKRISELNNIKIAIHHIAISYLMPSIINKLKNKHPNIKITIQNIAPNEAIKRLINDEIDIAFYPNLDQRPEIETIKTVSYKPILIMNKNHPLKNNKINTLADLKRFDLIRIDSNLITLPLFESAFKTYNLKGSIEFENGNWEILKKFVKNGDYVAVISEICLDKNDKDLLTFDLSKFFPQMTYFVALKKGKILNKATEDLLNTLKPSAA